MFKVMESYSDNWPHELPPIWGGHMNIITGGNTNNEYQHGFPFSEELPSQSQLLACYLDPVINVSSSSSGTPQIFNLQEQLEQQLLSDTDPGSSNSNNTTTNSYSAATGNHLVDGTAGLLFLDHNQLSDGGGAAAADLSDEFGQVGPSISSLDHCCFQPTTNGRDEEEGRGVISTTNNNNNNNSMIDHPQLMYNNRILPGSGGSSISPPTISKKRKLSDPDDEMDDIIIQPNHHSKLVVGGLFSHHLSQSDHGHIPQPQPQHGSVAGGGGFRLICNDNNYRSSSSSTPGLLLLRKKMAAAGRGRPSNYKKTAKETTKTSTSSYTSSTTTTSNISFQRETSNDKNLSLSSTAKGGGEPTIFSWSDNSNNNNQLHHDHDDPSSEPDAEAIQQMKEMIYREAAFRPVNLGEDEVAAVAVEKPKRKNVRISTDPQTVAARQRRERISDRLRVLQKLVPGGSKMDTASMLDEAANYLKFLRSQVRTLQSMASGGTAAGRSNNNNHNNGLQVGMCGVIPAHVKYLHFSPSVVNTTAAAAAAAVYSGGFSSRVLPMQNQRYRNATSCGPVH